jgi:cytochrome c5
MTVNLPTEHEAPHEGPIKTPKQLVVAVFFAFVIPIAIIVLLVVYVGRANKPAAGSDGLSPEATVQRIAPVGRVTVKDVNDPSALANGETVFKGQCISCHGAGALGAPKLGDAAQWAPRISHGYLALVTSSIKGKGAMPPQGGGDYTDLEIGRAVVYMANASGGKLEEPTMAPVLAASAAAPAAAAGGDAAAAAAAQAATAVAAANTSAAAAPAAAAVPALYTQVCQVCHLAGVAGAPKLGDKAAWAPRLADGIDGMTAIAIKGKGAMPPRGGSQATDAEIKEVVAYMASTVK